MTECLDTQTCEMSGQQENFTFTEHLPLICWVNINLATATVAIVTVDVFFIDWPRLDKFLRI